MNLQMTDQVSRVLDYDDLLARCLGNVDFVQRVLDKFRERCDEDMVALEDAVVHGDSDAVARLAHRLKGASANASAIRLREYAAEIEHAARGEALGDISNGLQGLKDEWSRFNSAFGHNDTPAESPTQTVISCEQA